MWLPPGRYEAKAEEKSSAPPPASYSLHKLGQRIKVPLMLRSVLREYGEFFLKKGLGLELAIAMVIGQQLTSITRSLSNDLLMPLLMPLLHAGNWHQWSISYFGNAIEVGKIINMGLNTLITGFVLFLILRVANRLHRVDV